MQLVGGLEDVVNVGVLVTVMVDVAGLESGDTGMFTITILTPMVTIHCPIARLFVLTAIN